MVGGLGPESTIDYYRGILELWRAEHPSSAPPVLIDSLDVDYGIELVRNDHPGLIEYLRDSVVRLASGGADFAVFAANTPHSVFENVAGLPILDTTELHVREIVRQLMENA